MAVHFLTVLSSKGRVFGPFPRDQGRIMTVSARVAEVRPCDIQGHATLKDMRHSKAEKLLLCQLGCLLFWIPASPCEKSSHPEAAVL